MEKNLRGYLYLPLLALAFFSCRKSDEYKMYMRDGEIIYPAKADSVQAHAGRDRIMLSWLKTDPRVIGYVIYWNMDTDSLLIDLPASGSTGNADTVHAMIGGLEEAEYEFNIVAIDPDGNRSVRSVISGAAFGDNYEGSLLNRGIRSVVVSPIDATAAFNWFAADSTDIGVKVTYTTLDDQLNTLILPKSGETDTITGYKPGTGFSYQTLFLPDSLAIDTFAASLVEVEAPDVTWPELDKSKFTSLVLPTDAPSAWGWIPEYLWDNNTAEGRGFHTADGNYPMHFTIDLGVSARLYEIKTWQREAGNSYFNEGNPRKFEIWGINEEPPGDGGFTGWTKLGEFESIKPSGLPVGTLTEEDRAAAAAGEVFRFEDGTIPVRYIRYKINEIWLAGRKSAHLMEISFRGDTR